MIPNMIFMVPFAIFINVFAFQYVRLNSKEICEEISFPSFLEKCWSRHFCWDSRLIGLMRDYVTCSKFTTILVCATFAQTFVALVMFSRGYSFHLNCFGNWLMIKFTFCIIKARLGGDFCQADVITHNGCYLKKKCAAIPIFFFLWIPIALTKIYFLRVVLTCCKNLCIY